MFIYLPEPYPDELLYSIVARYLAATKSRRPIKIIKAIFGERCWECSVGLPRRLVTVADRTWPTWNMSGHQIAVRLTMFPYCAAFLPQSQKEEAMNRLLSGKMSIAYLDEWMPEMLRFCTECRAEDLKEFKETYWRRSHQMKGIIVCPKHAEVLSETTISTHHRAAHFIDATIATGAGVRQCLQLNENERKQALAIAKRCENILYGHNGPLWADASPSLYRSMAMAKGLYGPTGKSFTKLLSTFKEMFSDNIIATTGMAQLAHSKCWLIDMFNPHGRFTFQPVAHVIVQEFLSKAREDTINSVKYGIGPWKCPNPFCDHHESFPIRTVNVQRDEVTGNLIASAKCCCGYYFNFFTTDSTDVFMPVVQKIEQYGPTWQREIQRLMSTGINAESISEILNISLSQIKDILETSLSQSIHEELRSRWIKVLQQTEHHTLTEASQVNYALYAKLKRVDPCFLYFSSSHIRPSTHTCDMSLHWEHRDKLFSKKVTKTIKSILAKKPPVRASIRATLKGMGLNCFYTYRNMLPKCDLALKNLCEPVEAFQKRRLRYVAENARQQGISLTRFKLFIKAGILPRYRQRLRKYVDSLL